MSATTKTNTTATLKIMILVAALTTLAATADAREWAVGNGGQKIEARVLRMAGQNLVLRTRHRELVVKIGDLTDSDRKYAHQLVLLRQSRNALLRQQNLALNAFYEGWHVVVIAPGGARLHRVYSTRNSLQARFAATRDFPGFMIGPVQRVQRRNFHI